MPHFDPSGVYMEVAYAVNPKFPQMSDHQLQILLNQTAKTVKDHFNIDLRFSSVKKISIETLFQILPERMKRNQSSAIFDFKNGSGDVKKLTAAMEKAIRSNRTLSVPEMIDYARPYLIKEPTRQTIEALASALVDTLLYRLEIWRQQKGLDGGRLIDSKPYNEWMMWNALGYGKLPFDIVLTNQLIASAEYHGQSIHSAIRGGIVAGSTCYSKYGNYGSYINWSTVLYSNEYDLLTELRGGETYGDEEAATLSGTYLAHEIGHQLLHLGHPYGSKACVMNPVVLLKFREWRNNLNPEKCRIGSSPEMKPGSINIFYLDQTTSSQ